MQWLLSGDVGELRVPGGGMKPVVKAKQMKKKKKVIIKSPSVWSRAKNLLTQDDPKVGLIVSQKREVLMTKQKLFEQQFVQ